MKALLKQLLEILAFIHDNKYVHRDIKCSNLLIDNNLQLKVKRFMSGFFVYSFDETRNMNNLSKERVAYSPHPLPLVALQQHLGTCEWFMLNESGNRSCSVRRPASGRHEIIVTVN